MFFRHALEILYLISIKWTQTHGILTVSKQRGRRMQMMTARAGNKD